MGKRVKPDDYYRKGAFEIARFGKQTIFRSNWGEKQRSGHIAKLIERTPVVQKEITDLIEKATVKILQLPPLQLLYQAYWLMASKHFGMSSETESTKDSIKTVQSLEFIQNVIVSRPPQKQNKTELSEDDLDEVVELVEEIYNKINFEFLISYSAKSQTDSEENEGIERIRQEAITHWVNVRGERYTVHEKQNFEDLLSGQNEPLQSVFGVSSAQIIEGLSVIVNALTFGIGDAMIEYKEIMQEIEPVLLLRTSQSKPATEDELRQLMLQVVDDMGLSERVAEIQSRAFGTALFDVQAVTGLPHAFIDALSWELGEEQSYFCGEEFSGWPLKATPIAKRPFIKINDRHYCFCLYALCDHFYRAIEKIVRNHDQSLGEQWNRNQMEITEGLPIKYLQKILPSSSSYQSIYYKWHPKEGHRKREWCEVDGLIIGEDHLIVIEVKAPAFSSQSPFDRFDTHIDSVRKLVGDPVRQGARFIEYLKSLDEVNIYDKNHKVIRSLRCADFRKITICALSIDPITEIASKAHCLKPLGIDTGGLPVWAISLDDLRACSDIFTEPLVFLHFLENRIKASQEMNVELDDELDHVGLYFEHNDYALRASEMAKGLNKLKFTGYRVPIDEFFSKRLLEPDTPSPFAQEMPPLYKEIFKFLKGAEINNTCEISSFLLDLGSDARMDLDQSVGAILSRQAVIKRVNYASLNGEVYLTVGCLQPHFFDYDEGHFIEHAKTELIMSENEERMLLLLTFDENASITAVVWERLFLKDIPESERSEYDSKIQDLKVRRLTHSRAKNGKVGRNEQCPCGSGSKYKRCCL